MDIPIDYMYKIIGIERTKVQLLEDENFKLREEIKKLKEEKDEIQKTLKNKIEGV